MCSTWQGKNSLQLLLQLSQCTLQQSVLPQWQVSLVRPLQTLKKQQLPQAMQKCKPLPLPCFEPVQKTLWFIDAYFYTA